MLILMITTKTPRQPVCRDDEDACDTNDTNYDHDEHTNDDDTDATGSENIVDLMTDDG